MIEIWGTMEEAEKALSEYQRNGDAAWMVVIDDTY
jgi:hypothetical protein